MSTSFTLSALFEFRKILNHTTSIRVNNCETQVLREIGKWDPGIPPGNSDSCSNILHQESMSGDRVTVVPKTILLI